MYFLPSKINLGAIKINEVGLGSSYTLGNAQLISRKNVNKKNQGFGLQTADASTIFIPIHIVLDADVFDFISTRT